MKRLFLFFGFTPMRPKVVKAEPVTGTAIVYMSKHGTTGMVATFIKELLMDEEVTLINLKKQQVPDLSHCSRIIIGGSIHMGMVQKKIQAFCQQNMQVLKSKPLGLYLCCWNNGEEAAEQFNNAFPEELRIGAKSKALVGYELYFERMNATERTMTREIIGTAEFMSQIDHLQLDRFVAELKS